MARPRNTVVEGRRRERLIEAERELVGEVEASSGDEREAALRRLYALRGQLRALDLADRRADYRPSTPGHGWGRG